MVKPDQKIVHALCVLQSQSPDAYKLLQQWFLDSAGHQDMLLRTAEQPHMLYRAQGGSKELLEVCQLLADPQELAGKILQEKAGIRTPVKSSGFKP